jgi:hypothetical protein
LVVGVVVVLLIGRVGLVAAVVVGVKASTPGSRRRSSWKWTRAAMRSLENSRAEWVPAWMGAVKRGQRAVQACWKEGRVREAARARASWTAAVKRVQRSAVSCGVVLGRVAGGLADRMETKSGLVSVGKCKWGTEEVRRE